MAQTAVIRCRGARAAEVRLLAEIDRCRPRDAGGLAAPLRVIVPSASLRQHVAQRVVAALGAVAGVVVQTAYGAALEVLERAGSSPPAGDPAFELLVRRQVAREPTLNAPLAAFDDGAAVVLAAVRDLLDAGFERSLSDAVLESVAAVGPAVAGERRERAAAVVRVAATVSAGLEALETDRAAAAVATATTLLQASAGELLPRRGTLIHGFADVTGLVADWLAVLLAGHPGGVILDLPPAPTAPLRDDPGVAFLDRLSSHLGALPGIVDEAPPRAVAIETRAAASVADEVREVAHRVRRLLDHGVVPESIAIVARRLDRHAPALRDWFEVLGIPFSGIGATVPSGWPRRRLERLLVLLDGLAGAAVEALDEASWWVPGRERVRLALRVLGAVQVADVAAIPPPAIPAAGVRLPLIELDEDDTDAGPHQLTASAAAVAAAVTTAGRLVALDAAWPSQAGAAEHLTATRELLDLLGWPAAAGERAAVLAAAATVASALPVDYELTRREWRWLLESRLATAAAAPLGGAGGGVQVLTVTEARGRTFRALFLIGLERGEFPRVMADDPVLPDAIRQRLAGDVLPFLPVRARSAAEERYLFAQLLAAADTVCCSWAAAEGGRHVAGSPFVAQLPAAAGDDGDRVTATGDALQRRPAAALEHAVAAAGVPLALLAPLLEAALEEAADVLRVELGVAPARLAVARMAVVAAAEAPATDGLDDPWCGRVGAAMADPAAGPWVTHLERTAICPWQAFLTQRLGIRPLPDPRAALPDLDPLLVGQVVHRVLQRIVDLALGERVETLGRATTRTPQAVAWPDAARVEILAEQAAARVAAEAGLGSGRIGHLLAAAALPPLAIAHEIAWGRDGRPPEVLGAELWGEVELAEPPVQLRFRADRVDAAGDALEAVDYKTGKPLSEAVKESTRYRYLLAAVAAGHALQAVAYALAFGGSGCYAYLRAARGEPPAGARVARVDAADEDAAAAFRRAVATILAARRVGAMFPRVEDLGSPDSLPAHCRFCSVTEACRRDDSGFRRRVVAGLSGAGASADPVVAAARELWRIGAAEEA